jgi:hypothetical protein
MVLTAIHRVNGRTGEHAELRRLLNNAAIQDTPYKVHYREQATESLRLLMHSESRTDAIVLAALMEVQPKHPLVPKIVRGLIEARVRGRWETTQANAYALVALSMYYKHYEKVVPDYRLRVWLGDGYIGQTTFRGRTMRVVEQKVPMAFIQDQGRKALILEKQGKGKVYYRLGLRYAPTSLRLAPEEQGFSVQREYEPVEGADTVVKLPGGRYRIKAGKYVRVRLRIVVPSRRYFVVRLLRLLAQGEAGRPGGALLGPAAVGRLRVHLPGPGDDHRHLRGAAAQGQRDVSPRGLWPERHEDRGDREVAAKRHICNTAH